MSKTIYEVAIRRIDDMFDSWDRGVHQHSIEIIEEALQKAQKQEKLLELYRELDDCIVAPEGHHVCRYTDDEKYARIRKQIKELENDE